MSHDSFHTNPRDYQTMSNIPLLRSCAALAAAVLLPVLLNSCVGISEAASGQAVRLGGSNRTSTVTVLGKAETWRNAGVIVQPGSTYEIIATGQWRAAGWPFPWGTPDGTMPPLPRIGASIVPGLDYIALVGKVGANGTPFAVGSRHTLTPSTTGTLYFRSNDTPGCCGDNEGQVTVTTRLVSGGASNDSSPRVIYRDRNVPVPVPQKPDWR